MQIGSYIFQSPYSQPLQVGRPDPSALKAQQEASAQQLDKEQTDTAKLIKNTAGSENSPSIKSSAIYQSDERYRAAESSIKSFQEAQRFANVTAYTNNNLESSNNS